MSVIGNPLLLGGDAGAPSYLIDRSVRLRSSASAYFNRTQTTTTNSVKCTFSGWVKRGTLGVLQVVFGGYTGTDADTQLYFDTTNQLKFTSRITNVNGAAFEWAGESAAVFRDPSAWYHIVVAVDTSTAQATNNAYYTVYVNNVAQTFTTVSGASLVSAATVQNRNTCWNVSGYSATLGRQRTNYFDGYLTEVNFIDGQALTPSSFGEYDSVRNTQWKPKAYSGSWGTNGFYLKFSNPASIGLDSSGNGNNWTANNIQTSNSALTTYDSMLDVPTLTSESASNFAVLNPLDRPSSIIWTVNPTFSEGNLRTAYASGTIASCLGSIPVNADGKWYWEVTLSSQHCTVGIYPSGSQTNSRYGIEVCSSGIIINDGTLVQSGLTAFAVNDVIGISYDSSTRSLQAYRNGSSHGTAVTLSTTANAYQMFPLFADLGSTQHHNMFVNFGQRPFAYTPPTGFKALNTFNLPDGAVPSSDDYHKVYTYTGNGGGLQVGEIQKPLSLYNLDRSLRFKGVNSYFDKVFASGGANTKGTISMWVKRGKLGVQQELFRFGTTGTLFSGLYFSATDTLNFVRLNSTYQTALYTTKTFRDPLNWIHIVVAWDTTLATTADRVKIYVNGIQETAFTSATYPTQNLDMYLFTAGTHNIGRYPVGGNYFGGYMAEFHAVDGTQLTPDSFGQFDGNYYWTPKDYTGGYGTNGWHLDFEDFSSMSATGIGKDVSGNGNNFTPYNFNVTVPANTNVAWDSMVDVPTLNSADVANFATANPLNAASGLTISDGNLKLAASAAGSKFVTSSIPLPVSGLFYSELTFANTATASIGQTIGIQTATRSLTAVNNAVGAYLFYASAAGALVAEGTTTASSLATITAGETFQLAIDLTNNKMWIGRGDVWYNATGGTTGNPSTGANPTFTGSFAGYLPYAGFDTASAVSANWNFGQRPFRYTPPTGFKSLNSFNVAEVTGDLESPDFVWIKSRSAATGHALFNSVTGVGKYLSSNATTAETTDVNSLIQFNKNGFMLGNAAIVNTSAATYVASAWKVAATTVANTDGTIASQVRANPTAGISVVTYTGTGANATVGHGLGVAPKMVIAKSRNNSGTSYQWVMYHASVGAGSIMVLNATNAAIVDATSWNNLAPTATVVNLGTNTHANGSASQTVAYCFSEIAGFSKFGSYVGNGATDGPFVYLGFRPRWVMIKRTDTTADWIIWDTERSTINAATANLYPDLSNVEYSDPSVALDFLSNGFKLRNTNIARNASGGTYIFAAFAEHPFKYSLGR